MTFQDFLSLNWAVSEDIASKIKAAVNSIADIELDLSVNTDSVKKAVKGSVNEIEPDVDSSAINQFP